MIAGNKYLTMTRDSFDFDSKKKRLGLAKRTRQQAEGRDSIDSINHIHFEDSEVERVCHEHGVYTYDDARNVTDMSKWFQLNLSIQHFDELKYFRNVKNFDLTFDYCNELLSVTIPGTEASTTKMFNNCGKLREVKFEEGFKNIYEKMFYGCDSMEEITLPETLQEIRNNAFSFTRIHSLTIPDSCKKIERAALCHIYDFKVLSLPCKDVLSLSEFSDYKTAVYMAASVNSNLEYAFRDKPAMLESLSRLGLAKKARQQSQGKDAVENVGVITFEDPEVEKILHRWEIYTYEDARNVTDINGWFKYKTIKKFNELKFFTGIKSTYGMFEGCELLESVTIPMNVESIGDEAFHGCNALKDVKIESKKIRSIGYKAFMYCAMFFRL